MTSARSRPGRSTRTGPRRAPGSARVAALLAACFATALLVYRPALDGPLVSDDAHYLGNPYVRELSWERLPALLDPAGEPARLIENYAPVHLLLHALEWKLFGERLRPFHVVNVALHAMVSVLLIALLLRSGVPSGPALFGGGFFLLHPANVEAVAWISQLKTLSSTLLALAALWLLPRRPTLATLAFALSLLAKATAAFTLPVAAVFAWVRWRSGSDPGRRPAAWLCAWTVIFLAFAVVEFTAFERATWQVAPVDADPWVRLRSAFELVARYLAMAATSYGVSAFQEPEPAVSLLGPWWLDGLAAVAALGVRALLALRGGREEAAWWVWAAVSFLPVAQIFPFPFPLADRYLYQMLPGLLGGTLLALLPLHARLPTRSPALERLLLVAGVAVLLAFAARSHERAALWSNPALLAADAAIHYPNGRHAHLLRAHAAARRGEFSSAVDSLRGAYARGFDRFEQLLAAPDFVSLRRDPRFRALLRDMAGRWIERIGPLERPSQSELYSLAIAHRLRGEEGRARSLLERALVAGGPLDGTIRAELAESQIPRELLAPGPPGDAALPARRP